MKKRNTALDIFRYVCAILVIAIHTNPFREYSSTADELIQNIARIAVPFFFATSGYYFVERFRRNPAVVKTYLWRLFKLYLVWSGVYFILDFIKWGHTTIVGFVSNCILTFFVYGSHYHLWYMVALICAVCITALFLRFCKEKWLIVFSVAIVMARVLPLGIVTDVANSNFFAGLPFFTVGLVVRKIEAVSKIPSKVWLIISFAVFTLWLVLAQMQIVSRDVQTVGLYVVILVIMLALVQNPTEKAPRMAAACQDVSDFAYFFHPVLIEVLLPVVFSWMGLNVMETEMFLTTIVTATLAGLCSRGVRILIKNRKKGKISGA